MDNALAILLLMVLALVGGLFAWAMCSPAFYRIARAAWRAGVEAWRIEYAAWRRSHGAKPPTP
jgi:hypothetical protein